MSITLDRNNTVDHTIERPGFMTCIPIYKSSEFGAGDRWAPAKEENDDEDDDVTSSSSSIGRNSDESPAGRSSSDGDGEEVQSAFKQGALDNLEALEEVLPIKRGISKFYAGKSKSFTSLAGAASCSSLKDIVKPEDAYSRKRKNLLAHNNFFDKNRNHFPRSNIGGIYKRPTNSKSSLVLGSCSESNNSSESLNSSPPSPRLPLTPLPPQPRRYTNESSLSPSEPKFIARRSFSLFDLQGGDGAATTNLTDVKE